MLAAIVAASLCITNSVSAFAPLDMSFPDQRITMPIIAPGDNYLYIQNNDQDANTPILFVLSIFTSTNDYGPEWLESNVAWQPTGTTSLAFLIAPGELPIQLAGNTMRFDEGQGLDLRTNTTGVLYYLTHFIDGTLTTHKVDYSGCLEAARSDLANVECRAESQDGAVMYTAYRDNIKIEYEPEDAQPDDVTDIPEDTSSGKDTPDAADGLAEDAKGDNSNTSDDTVVESPTANNDARTDDDTPRNTDDTNDAATENNLGANPVTQPSVALNSSESVQENIVSSSSQEILATTAKTVRNVMVNNSSVGSVKNTKTDETDATTSSTIATGDNNILPPSDPQPLNSGTDFTDTTASNSTEDIHWWAVYPLFLVSAALFWFFLIFPKRRSRDDSEQEQFVK